jgi:hypothetical protein
MKAGATCHNLLFWRRVADGAWAPASNAVVFEIKGLAPVVEEPATPGFPAASQTLAAATQDALKAALDARIASGSAGEWIVDLPSGFYGNLSLDGRKLPGRTILRSQDLALGAKFTGINLSGCRNVFFQLIDVDRLLGNPPAYGVKMAPARDCGVEYSRIHVGGIRTNSAKQGWAPNLNYAVELNNAGADRTERCRIHMNLISGVCAKGIYINGTFDSEISENVFENSGDDCVHMGWGSRVRFVNNWGARAYYPNFSTSTGWAHNDFIQVNSQSITVEDLVFHGNVMMFGPEGLQFNPRQGIFSSKTHGTGWDYEGNILVTNSAHGLTCGPAEQFSNTRARRNTVLRCIDAQGNQNLVQLSLGGAVEMDRNVQCGPSGNRSMGANGLNIAMNGTDYTGSLAYYTAPYLASSFYDLRPVEGAPTHWAYAGGQPIGAYERFRDVIMNGAYPKIGPAAAAWKAWYDPKNQITS